jgi:hypothetical protein
LPGTSTVNDATGRTRANNPPPVVTAGPSQAVTLPATASLVATARDDAKPSG